MGTGSVVSEEPPSLSALVPRVVLRAPFVAKELGRLRYLSTHAGGATVAVFDSGVALRFHGDVRAMAAAFARFAELKTA
jgi:hypothetical protein